MISRSEVVWILNSSATSSDLIDTLDELAVRIETGELYFDTEQNLHASPQGRAKLKVMPRATD
jgi:hypothetical protein